VWWDTRLKAGEFWDEVIERELKAARCVVVLWSKTSVDRHWVRVEANDGLQRRILVPALIENVRPPLAFSLVQAEQLLGWSGEPSHTGLNRLLGAISERMRTQPLPDLAVFRDIDASWYPEMVALPAGEFLMGSPEYEVGSYENRRDRVTIDRRFAIGRYAVTFDEYDHFCAATELKKPEDRGWGRGRRPVIEVSWQDAVAYCVWLANETGQPYRLPSEAEWEYAARAGTTTRYAFGDAITPKDANYSEESKLGKTTEVGAYPPNAWGLYDMHGNVWEWVKDVYHDSYLRGPTDGTAWIDSEGENSARNRVIRGGSWNDDPWRLRSAGRGKYIPGYGGSGIGFRVARTLD
jgi:formylglycine-generating enzyme required for sulfatase activity